MPIQRPTKRIREVVSSRDSRVVVEAALATILVKT
jgi:hypothetical protein